MADPFEHELSLMLEEAPPLDGEDAFAAAVEARMEAAWRVRRWGLGLAAVAGAGVAALALANVGSATLASLAAMTDQALALGVTQGADAAWILAACLVALAAVVAPRLLAEI